METLALALEAEGIGYSPGEQEEKNSKYSCCISAEALPEALKALLRNIQETYSPARLFIIDVCEPGGRKIFRVDAGTSRPHLLEAATIMESWLRQKLAGKVSATAVWAILSEAAVSPKPGLVDRFNSGSHRDMDFFTLIDSASALLPWFRECALTGFNSGAGEDIAFGNSGVLFETLRRPGRMAEVLMKKAAGGTNTHRGYIFSLGILSAAYGRIYRITEKPDLNAILEFTKAMTTTLAKDFSPEGREASHGELVYTQTGIQGIRGEISRGLPSVTEHGLPLLRRMLKEGASLNDAGIIVLLELIAHAEDTNIIYRGGVEVFRSLQNDLRTFLASEPDMETVREKAAAMDKEFITKNLSPGGSADLLGITFFLWKILESGK